MVFCYKEALVQQGRPSDDTDQSALKEFIRAQLHEMEKFRWRLGEKLGHDPILDRSVNEIYGEWLCKYGEAFKRWWENRNNCSFTMHFKIDQMIGK